MDTKSINSLTRALKRTKPKREDFGSNSDYLLFLIQWKNDVLSLTRALYHLQSQFDMTALLTKCGYEKEQTHHETQTHNQ